MSKQNLTNPTRAFAASPSPADEYLTTVEASSAPQTITQNPREIGGLSVTARPTTVSGARFAIC